MIKTTALVFGIIGALLGALWMLQGLGIVHLRPILCFADCAPVRGTSVTWVAVGVIALSVGAGGVFWARKQAKD